MRLRSLLFIPGDRPDRFELAAATGADVLILDLEDSVAPERKALARDAVREWLESARTTPLFVRVNPLDSGLIDDDLTAILPGAPNGLVLPRAEGAPSVRALIERAGVPLPPILPIAIETPGAILGNWPSVAGHLAGLAWHATDHDAVVRAVSSNEANGVDTARYDRARALLVFAANATPVPAIDIAPPHIAAEDAVEACIRRARDDGFGGMMTVHPAQVDAINRGFTPSPEELASAEAIVAAFASSPGFEELKLAGKTIRRRHLAQAQRILGLTVGRTIRDEQGPDLTEPMGIA